MADNVVQITVTSKNSTKAGFKGATADAESAAGGISAIFEKMGKNVSKHLAGIGQGVAATGGIFAAGGGLLAMASPLAAATVAMGAFGAVAIPVLSRVSAAQKALSTAQQAYANATTAAQRKSALQAEAKATSGLSDAQKGLLGPLAQIQKAFSKLQDVATPALGALLRLGASLMPLFGTLVKAGGSLVQAIAAPLAALVKSPFFTQFTKTIAVLAAQMGPILGATLVSLIKLFGELLIKLGPVGIQLLKVLLPAIIQLVITLTPFLVLGAKVVNLTAQWAAANRLLVPALGLITLALIAMKLQLLSNPLVLIALAIVALAMIVVRYHTQIWQFITRIWGDIAGFFKRIWGDIRNIFLGGVRFIADLWLAQAGMIVHAAAFAFGWIPGIGGKLKEAAKAFDKFRENVNRALSGVQGRTVNVAVAFGGVSPGHKVIGQLAGGTSGAVPGWSWIGEEGPELVHMQGGETVVPHGQSMRMTRGYAGGVGVVPHLPSMAAIQAVVSTGITAVATAFARGLASIGNIGGTGVARWAPVILRALGMLGQDSSNLGPVEHRMNQESGGNPRAINLWDINAQRGDPSRGLMQVIGSTFAAYRSFALSGNIYDPMANVFAGLNYAVNSPAYRGRSLASVMMQPGGYRGGTGGGRMPPLRVEIVFRTTGTTDLDRALLSWFKKATVNNGGGSVQAAFGS